MYIPPKKLWVRSNTVFGHWNLSDQTYVHMNLNVNYQVTSSEENVFITCQSMHISSKTKRFTFKGDNRSLYEVTWKMCIFGEIFYNCNSIRIWLYTVLIAYNRSILILLKIKFKAKYIKMAGVYSIVFFIFFN